MDFEAADTVDLQRRIHIDFIEWPTLRLTLRQARRLWDAPIDMCEGALAALVRLGVLAHSEGVFHRRGLGRQIRTRSAPYRAAPLTPSDETRHPSSGSRPSDAPLGEHPDAGLIEARPSSE